MKILRLSSPAGVWLALAFGTAAMLHASTTPTAPEQSWQHIETLRKQLAADAPPGTNEVEFSTPIKLELHAAAIAFAKDFPDDPHRWDAALLELKTVLFPTPLPERRAVFDGQEKLLADILAAPGASPEVKQTAERTVLFEHLDHLDLIDTPTLAAALEARLSDFIARHPDDPKANALQVRRLDLIEKSDPAKAAALLDTLSASADPKVVEAAQGRREQRALADKPLDWKFTRLTGPPWTSRGGGGNSCSWISGRIGAPTACARCRTCRRVPAIPRPWPGNRRRLPRPRPRCVSRLHEETRDAVAAGSSTGRDGIIALRRQLRRARHPGNMARGPFGTGRRHRVARQPVGSPARAAAAAPRDFPMQRRRFRGVDRSPSRPRGRSGRRAPCDMRAGPIRARRPRLTPAAFHPARPARRGGDFLRLGIFAAIHGDEPEGALALREFLYELAAHPRSRTAMRFMPTRSAIRPATRTARGIRARVRPQPRVLARVAPAGGRPVGTGTDGQPFSWRRRPALGRHGGRRCTPTRAARP